MSKRADPVQHNPVCPSGRLFERYRGLALWLMGFGVLACSPMNQPGADASRGSRYRHLVSVTSLEAYYHTEPRTKLRYPLVRGVLLNRGNQTLTAVELSVHFLDATGKPIHEEKNYPIYVSEFSQTAGGRALGPFQSLRFAFKVPACPGNWQPGRIHAEVSKVVLANLP
ncbi:MAG: hypothetical protein AB1898_20780 [Acidobacteriota bacterium]